MRRVLFFVGFFLCAGHASLAQQHMNTPGSVTQGATTPQSLAAKDESFARDILSKVPNAVIDRQVTQDIAMPSGKAEYARLNGYAVGFISALSRDGTELPLSRLYLVDAAGRQVPLRRLGSIRKTVSSSSATARLFGGHQQLAFYLIPVALLKPGTRLVCDFAKNRRDFTVGGEFSPDPQFAGLTPASNQLPSRAAIQALIDREFPGFGIAITEGGLR